VQIDAPAAEAYRTKLSTPIAGRFRPGKGIPQFPPPVFTRSARSYFGDSLHGCASTLLGNHPLITGRCGSRTCDDDRPSPRRDIKLAQKHRTGRKQTNIALRDIQAPSI